MPLLTVAVTIMVLALLIFIMKLDWRDTFYPKGILQKDSDSEDYPEMAGGDGKGKNLYYGINEEDDDINTCLDKAEWLAHIPHRVVLWRRALAIAIIVPILVILMTRNRLPRPREYTVTIPAVFVLVYFYSHFFYSHHDCHGCAYTTKNINRVKEMLGLRHHNNLMDTLV
jgi:hypothetical protein